MPESLTRRESAYVNLWGVRLHVGMASGFSSERCPASPRNRVRLQVGIASGIASEYLAGISRNLHVLQLVEFRHVPRHHSHVDGLEVEDVDDVANRLSLLNNLSDLESVHP